MLIRLELFGFHFEFGHDQAEEIAELPAAPADSQYPMAVQGWHPDEFGFRQLPGWEDRSVKPH
jgi:hypothetical protein